VRRWFLVLSAIAAAFACSRLHAHADNSDRKALGFEVASVKPGRIGGERIGMAMRGEQLRATNLPLRVILQWAYNKHGS